MSLWRGLSWQRKAMFLAMIAIAFGISGWVIQQATAQTALEEGQISRSDVESAEDVAAPLPQPEQVFVQRTSAFPASGNVLVTARISAAELAEKQEAGTADFVTIGNPDSQVILRDDGQGGDARAGDGVFTGIAFVDEADLAAKETEDASALNGSAAKEVPVFDGRVFVGTEAVQPFDYDAFNAGQAVEIGPGLTFVEPETNRSDLSAHQTQPGTSQPGTPSGGTLNARIEAGDGGITSATAAAVVLGTNNFQERVLVIRNTAVVQDPARTWNPCTGAGNANGVWTFNHLMTQMANQPATGIDPADFADQWLRHWLANQPINGDNVLSRAQMNSLLTQWPKQPNGKLDLTRSPMRLLAIMPRVDLRRTTGGGGGGYSVNTSGNFIDAGEARFIFGVVLRPGWSGAGFVGASTVSGYSSTGGNTTCRALPFSVIFEYRVPKCDCTGVRDWARGWTELANFTPGTTAYNTRLERLTQQFVRSNANPGRPNGSALGQLRTNEIALTAPWELREFQLTQAPWSFLRETTIADTPEDGFNGTATLLNWILTVAGSANQPPVPLLRNGAPFLAGNSLVPNVNDHWTAPGVTLAEANARFGVSIAACDGCHAREPMTPFVHVDPADPTLPANISPFLSGINGVADPVFPAILRDFDDLARREVDIKAVARLKCFHFRPISLAHVQDSIRSTGRLPADLFFGQTTQPHHVSVAVEDMRRNLIREVH